LPYICNVQIVVRLPGERATGAGRGRQARQDEGVQVVVLSDTHAPRRWKSCPPAVAERVRGADLVLHAGDVCTAAVLDELSGYAPVRAVLGNNDGPDVRAWGARPVLEFDLAGLPVAMIHDSGLRQGRLRRLRRQFPAARLVVFGHSHIPLDERSESGERAARDERVESAVRGKPGERAERGDPARADDEFRIFNPGSPTDRRRQPHGTLGVLRVEDGRLLTAEIVAVT
jgi:putative phosphoesterase